MDFRSFSTNVVFGIRTNLVISTNGVCGIRIGTNFVFGTNHVFEITKFLGQEGKGIKQEDPDEVFLLLKKFLLKNKTKD